MRVKKRIIITFMLVALMVFTGCVSKPADQVQPTDKPSVNLPDASVTPPQGITVNKINFTEVSLNDLASDRIELISNLSSLRGYYFWAEDNGGYTVFIGMGEKPTGGYQLNALSVEDNEGKTNILVEEIIPKADDVVSQALTYPYIIIEMKGVTDRFTIMNSKNEEYKLINVDDLKEFTVEGVYQGQIDNNSIEVKIDDSFIVLRNSDMTLLVAGLKKDDPVIITYKIAANGQYIMESIKNTNIENNESQIVIAVYQGQIDNNSIEVKIGETYAVFRNAEMSKLIANYKKDDIVKITYTTLENGQFSLLKIEPGK